MYPSMQGKSRTLFFFLRKILSSHKRTDGLKVQLLLPKLSNPMLMQEGL